MRLILGALIALLSCQAADVWSPLRVFAGKWEGPASGEPGKGRSAREYRFELNGKFLYARNTAAYEPKTEAAEGEVHEDWSLFSYDRALNKIVLRQFHGEGFVNEYTLDSISDDGKTLEFTTLRIENIPPGWRAKESYRILSPDEIEETFSLAAPGKEFAVYSRTLLRRVK